MSGMNPPPDGFSGHGTSGRFRVAFHAGYAAEERPLRFGVPGGRRVEVLEVLSRVREEDAVRFRVLGDDGARWMLSRERGAEGWTALRE